MCKSKRTEKSQELDQIYGKLKDRRSYNNEQNLKRIMSDIDEYVKGSKTRYLVLKAQKQAVYKNLDINMHIAIATLIVSTAAFIVSILALFMTGFVSPMNQDVEIAKMITFDVIWTILLGGIVITITIYVVKILKRIIFFMDRREDYSYISLCLEEYEKRHFSENSSSDYHFKGKFKIKPL